MRDEYEEEWDEDDDDLTPFWAQSDDEEDEPKVATVDPKVLKRERHEAKLRRQRQALQEYPSF